MTRWGFQITHPSGQVEKSVPKYTTEAEAIARLKEIASKVREKIMRRRREPVRLTIENGVAVLKLGPDAFVRIEVVKTDIKKPDGYESIPELHGLQGAPMSKIHVLTVYGPTDQEYSQRRPLVFGDDPAGYEYVISEAQPYVTEIASEIGHRIDPSTGKKGGIQLKAPVADRSRTIWMARSFDGEWKFVLEAQLVPDGDCRC